MIELVLTDILELQSVDGRAADRFGSDIPDPVKRFGSMTSVQGPILYKITQY